MSRLEEIRKEYKLFLENEENEFYDNSTEIGMGIIDNYLYWLIQQAERVQKLEEKHKEYVSFTESNNYNIDIEFEKLYKQNKRYREAIDYVMSAKVTHYTNLENALNDIKFVINETLEESKSE